jgi:hypothetical protein
VHYLYTGNYQTLKPHNGTTEYRRGILTYFAAKLYGLDSLADHAMRTVGLFDKEVSIFQILDIASNVYPKLLKDELWYPDHLKTKIEAAFKADETMFAQERFLNYISEATAFNKVLVKIMVGAYTDKIKSMAEKKCKSQECLFEIPDCCDEPVAKESALEEDVEECPAPPPPPSPPVEECWEKQEEEYPAPPPSPPIEECWEKQEEEYPAPPPPPQVEYWEKKVEECREEEVEVFPKEFEAATIEWAFGRKETSFQRSGSNDSWDSCSILTPKKKGEKGEEEKEFVLPLTTTKNRKGKKAKQEEFEEP